MLSNGGAIGSMRIGNRSYCEVGAKPWLLWLTGVPSGNRLTSTPCRWEWRSVRWHVSHCHTPMYMLHPTGHGRTRNTGRHSQDLENEVGDKRRTVCGAKYSRHARRGSKGLGGARPRAGTGTGMGGGWMGMNRERWGRRVWSWRGQVHWEERPRCARFVLLWP